MITFGGNHRVKLTRIKSKHENLRTDEILGECKSLPALGQSFSVIGPPYLSGYSGRLVWTTEILTCEYDEAARVFDFTTRNSAYRLQVLESLEQ